MVLRYPQTRPGLGGLDQTKTNLDQTIPITGEKEGQTLFFSPEKIARLRERNAVAEQAEQQRRRDTDDRKLQAAIARDEKAREAERKKNERAATRAAAREQLAHEKAERHVEREAKRAQKAEEAAKRKQEVEEKRAQRLQAKNAIENAGSKRKRSIDEERSESPRKRSRTTSSRSRNQSTMINSTIQLNSQACSFQMILLPMQLAQRRLHECEMQPEG